MKFNVILTTDAEYGVSKYNRLPWYFPEDVAFFEQTTTDHVCIMGKRTALDLKEPLKNRDNIVITRNLEGRAFDGFEIASSFQHALQLAAAKAKLIMGKQIFIIGGSRLFDEALSQSDQSLDKIYYLHISKSFNCDNFVRQPIISSDGSDTTTILDTKTVKSVDTIHAINKIGVVTLTFYLIKRSGGSEGSEGSGDSEDSKKSEALISN